MRNFIISNLPTIIILVAFLVYIIYLIVNRKWEELRALAYKSILQAEKVIVGTKMGQKKFEQVFTQIYNLIPPWLRLFFPKKTVREKLQKWFNDIKDYLDNGKLDDSLQTQQAL